MTALHSLASDWRVTRSGGVTSRKNRSERTSVTGLEDIIIWQTRFKMCKFWKKNYTCISFYLQAHNNLSVEIMNEWCIYIALFVYCCTPKALYNHGGGGALLNHHQCAASTWWCDGCHRTTAPVRSPHTSYRWRGERVIEPIKWMGIISRPWLTRASGGNLVRTPGLHPYSLREVPWDF